MEQPTFYRPSAIIQMVTRALGPTGSQRRARRRGRQLVTARQLTAYLLRRFGILSYSDIARMIGYRHHTTARHAVKRLADRLEREPYLRDLVRSLEVQAGIGPIPHRDGGRGSEPHTNTPEPPEEEIP